jgi:PleD family two-component response regulator
MGRCSLSDGSWDAPRFDLSSSSMILAVLDDLMFTSKIKTTANQLGVTVAFARSADAALAEMRKARPSLVVFDLNNPRTDPLGILARMKQDPALASVRTIGYASHVQTDVIIAARDAGVDDVMARSAFTEHLAAILVDS